MLAGSPVTVVAIDMPMSRGAISGRRKAENDVSRRFGAMGAAVHSPTPERPGPFGASIVADFEYAGFKLATDGSPRASRALVEVFPLAALVRLLRTKRRPAYKAQKIYKEWRGLPLDARRANLLSVWRQITEALLADGCEVGALLSEASAASTFAAMKGFEDALDAILCAWIGACFHRGRIEAFGDGEAAIWIPALCSTADDAQ